MIVASELRIGDNFFGHKVAALERFNGFTYAHFKYNGRDYTAKMRDERSLPEGTFVINPEDFL
jgi:hypothetical protein